MRLYFNWLANSDERIMAQAGNFTPILLYGSSTPGNVPLAANLTNNTVGSEIAINIADGKLFYKDSANAIQVIGWKTTPTTAGGTGLTSYTAGDMVYWASGTTFTKLGIGTANYIMTSSGTAPQWSASIGPAQGGTGITSYAVGDLIYASGTTTLSKLADVATGNALISGGVGVAPSWGKIDLTTHISGVLPVANGGTNASSASITAFNNITGYTATGATGTTSTNLVFSTSPSLVTPVISTTLGVGGATPAASGVGITFPATQSASTDPNTLDDYEEGTYVPTVTCSTSGTITLNTSYNTLNYTKVGRLVSVTGFLYVSSVSSPVGYINITTPFTPGGTNKYSELSILISGSTVNCNVFVARQDSGGPINVFRGDSTSFALTSANTIQANTEFYISLTYQST